MTQDILMSNEQPATPSADTARNQLQQFCILAKSAHGAAILELIKQVLEAPGIYVFAELLAMPNIQELKDGPHAKYFNTLDLFAYGTYKQYRQQQDKYLELSVAMQKKLQHLTIVSLAIKTKCIPYSVLLEELDINNVRHLEDVIIEAIYAETLRKYPVQPHLIRQSINNYPVPNTRYVIERGVDVIIPIFAIHNDPSLYPEPQTFDPERFSLEQCARRHSSAYLPFGDGPRNCIGMRFGELQVKIGIIKLLQHYRLKTTAKTQIPLRFSKKNFLIASESGIYLELEKL